MPSFDPFGLGAFGRQLQANTTALSRLEGKVSHMSDELAALQAAVSNANTAVDSAIILLNKLKDKLDAAIASGDPAALAALSTSLGTETDKLNAAIIADTPATPAPAAEPAVEPAPAA